MQNKNTLIILIGLGIILSFNNSFGQNDKIKQDSSLVASDTAIYTILPTMPSFGEDYSELQNFIVKESKYPASKTRTNTTKNVFVQVIIEKDGKVKFDKIVRGIDEKFDTEARRIAEKMPNWTIGRLSNGKPARIFMMFPIWFE